MNDRSVGMVYPPHGHRPTKRRATDYGHPAHRGFARAVGADDIVVPFYSLPGPVRDTCLTDIVSTAVADYPEHDVFVTESDATLYAAPTLKRRFPGAKIVHLAASDRLLRATLARRPDEPRRRTLKRWANNRLDTALLQRILPRYCDGVIAVSGLARDRIRAFAGEEFPVPVAHPFIQPDLFASLTHTSPDLSGNVAVTVCAWRDHKGMDLLVDAWPRVRERHPDAELHIVGPGHPARYAETLGVSIHGYVADLETALRPASLYVHPARLEAFGVSVVEAMCAGVPAIATETTGAASAVRDVDGSLVVPPHSVALADAVADYFDADEERRRALSRAARDASAEFTEARQTARFREGLWSILG